MSDLTDENIKDVLVDEPEEEIDKLSDMYKFKVPTYPSAEGLITLTKKVYPYTVGLMIAFFTHLTDFVNGIGSNILKAIVELISKSAEDLEAEQYDMLKKVFNYSDSSIEFYHTIRDFNRLLGALFYFAYVTFGTLGLITAEVFNLKTKIMQKMNEENPVNLPDVNAILGAYIKQGLEADETMVLLRQHGFSPYKAQVFLDSIKRIPDVEILFQNLWRGKITADDMGEYLSKLAFDKDEQVLITNLAERIPPIQDIIRFSVREAFHDDLSKKYGHDAEFPPDVASWGEQQGYSEYWTKKYWRAHWELPSVQMAFEMMHRAVKKDDGNTFTQDDITDLLKMQDYPVAWRKLLIQISYRVITRVDARRMYDLGVWDNLGDITAQEKLKQVYMSQGYNDEDSGYMVDFTEQYHIDKRRGFTKAGLKKIYKYGIISETGFRDKLTNMRIRNEEIEFLIDEANYEMEDKKLDSFMAMAKAMFQNGRWDKTDVQLEMSKVGLHVSNPDNLFESWDYDKRGNRRVLTKADIQRLLKKGLIGTRENAVQRFLDLGYDKQSSEWLTDEVTITIEEV